MDTILIGKNFPEHLKAARTLEEQSKDIFEPPSPNAPAQKSQYKPKQTYQP